MRTTIFQNLYILAFKNEPLIKVGLSIDAYMRSLALGFDRFDFKGSYMVQARDQSSISVLERNLKTFFSANRVSSSEPLSSGNTETFQSSVLPQMLQAIEALRETFPDAGFRIQQDLSSIIPIRRDAPGLSGAEQKAKRLEKTTRLLMESIEQNERKLQALEELLPKIPVHSIQVVEESEKQFSCEIHLNDGQIAIGYQLFETGRMNILFSKHGGHPGSLGWGINALDTGIKDDTCSVHLYFNLEHEHRPAESIVQSDIATRSLTLWRNFVSKQQPS
jgi:hypothetical protein